MIQHVVAAAVVVTFAHSLSPFSRWTRLAGVYWSKGWRSYKSCKAPVKSSPPTNQHTVFTDQMPFPSPNQQCQSTEGKYHIPWTCLPQARLGVFQLCLWRLIAPGYLGGGLPCLSAALWCQYPIYEHFYNYAKIIKNSNIKYTNVPEYGHHDQLNAARHREWRADLAIPETYGYTWVWSWSSASTVPVPWTAGACTSVASHMLLSASLHHLSFGNNM